MILGHLRDLAREGAIDFNRPLYVWIRCGDERLSKFGAQTAHRPVHPALWPQLDLRFVLCDLGDANLPGHERNPRLLPLLAAG